LQFKVDFFFKIRNRNCSFEIDKNNSNGVGVVRNSGTATAARKQGGGEARR
jgi:hypothetical protein